MTDPFASIIQEATVSHKRQFSTNPTQGKCRARMECLCGVVFSEIELESYALYNGAVRDRLWIEGKERWIAHLKEKGWMAHLKEKGKL